SGRVDGWIASILDVTERKYAENTERMLFREIEHRSKNLLAVIQSIAHRSLTGNISVDDARIAFEARLQALARAHDQLTKSNRVELPLEEVVRTEMGPFAARMVVKGDDVMLAPQLVQSFALVLHELATNAVKYGALSNSNGRVEITWKLA